MGLLLSGTPSWTGNLRAQLFNHAPCREDLMRLGMAASRDFSAARPQANVPVLTDNELP